MYYNINSDSNDKNIFFRNKNSMKANSSKSAEIDSIIQESIDKIRSLKDCNEVEQYFYNLSRTLPEITKTSGNVYRYNDYFIVLGKSFLIYPTVNTLKHISGLNLSCAPELISYTDLKTNKDCVLITELEGSNADTIVPYRDAEYNIDSQTKQAFLSDVDLLIQNNIALPQALDTKTWQYMPKTQKIILSDWSDFVGFKNDVAKNNYRKKIGEMLGKIY